MNRTIRPSAARWTLFALALGATLSSAGTAQERLAFLGVALDSATREADRRLVEHLTQKSGLGFAPEQLEYSRMIDRLVSWKADDGFFVARTTPYVYVAAEMLGADVEPLASYVSSASGRTTYSSYLVVSRQAFRERPSATDVVRFLRERRERARFVYQSQFSTSSYILPLLFFRSVHVFHMPESTESLTAIEARRLPEGSGSTSLVEAVARGDADIAAVWDDTKARVEIPGNAVGAAVHFVQLPTTIPNDLLVVSKRLDPARKKELVDAVRALGDGGIGVGDFLTWKSVADATDARLALANLRWLARERLAPVTVEIVIRDGGTQPGTPKMLEGAREAVRLAGTEFVLFDADFHEHIDVRWTLEPTHDGALTVSSSIPGADLAPQVFRLSFRDREDLTRRLVLIAQSRMHRIRYVWPFSGHTPIVTRDIAFPMRAGSPLKVQAITWIDPERNKFRAGPVFSATVRHANDYRYELDPGDFVRNGGAQPALDPMSNSGYRVILLRPAEERFLFKALTMAVIACFLLGGGAAIADVARGERRVKSSSRAPSTPVNPV